MTDHNDLNAASRDRLRALGERSDDALVRTVDEDWTASALLAHVAFWDRLTAARWTLAIDRGEDVPMSLTEELTELINVALLPEWRALPVRTALELAARAAEAVDALVADLDERYVEAARGAGLPRLVDRSQHRREHLDAIEQVLAHGS